MGVPEFYNLWCSIVLVVKQIEDGGGALIISQLETQLFTLFFCWKNLEAERGGKAIAYTLLFLRNIVATVR